MVFFSTHSLGTSICFVSKSLGSLISALCLRISRCNYHVRVPNFHLDCAVFSLNASDIVPKRPFVPNIRQSITSFSELVPKRFEFDCVVVESIQISVYQFSARLHRASESRVKRAIGVGC